MSEHAPASANFSDTEWASLRAEDFAAARAVVLLMIGIFGTGVILYLLVAYTVISKIGFLA